MKLHEIDRASERWQAYMRARENPGTAIRFQAEEGLAVVRYSLPVPAVTLFGQEIEPSKSGFWYEVPIRDDTRIMPDRRIGFRVYDESDEEPDFPEPFD